MQGGVLFPNSHRGSVSCNDSFSIEIYIVWGSCKKCFMQYEIKVFCFH